MFTTPFPTVFNTLKAFEEIEKDVGAKGIGTRDDGSQELKDFHNLIHR